MRLFAVLFILVALVAPDSRASEAAELMNSTLVAKLHLERDPLNSQMVGALQIKFRNRTQTPLSKVSVLLNPGLQFIRAVGFKNQQLRLSSSVSPIDGNDILELNRAEITLRKPLKINQQAEIVIHYRGYLQDISWAGIAGAKDSLHPDFTMIRARAFAYPVFAQPNMAAITGAWNHKPFHQVAFVELASSNDLVGNLATAEKNLENGKTKFELKSLRPTTLMTLALGPYTTVSNGLVSVSYLDAGDTKARAITTAVRAETDRIAGLLGPAPTGAKLRIVEVRDGYGNHDSHGVFFREPGALDAARLKTEAREPAANLWRLNANLRTDHWAAGLDEVLMAALSGDGRPNELRIAQFDAAKQLFSANSALGKTPLGDYAMEGFTSDSKAVSALAFAALHAIMGDDAFFAFIRTLRAKAATGYTDMAVAAEIMADSIKHKQGRKFAKNWFSSGKSGKDMKKAKSFNDLIERY